MPHASGVKHEILEKSQWTELVDEQRYNVEQNGRKGTAAWEVDFADFKDFQPDQPAAEEPADARDSLEGDLTELFGSEGMTIRNKLREAFDRYGDRIGMAAIQGGLRREGVTNVEDVHHVRNLMTAVLRGVRPSDVSKRVTLRLINKDRDIFTLLRDLPETLEAWRQEEDDAFIDEVFDMGSRGGFIRRFFGGGVSEKQIKTVLRFILSGDIANRAQVESVLTAQIGKRFAQEVSSNVYQYATGDSEGDRKAEMLERAQYFGMTDAEVEALVRARG